MSIRQFTGYPASHDVDTLKLKAAVLSNDNGLALNDLAERERALEASSSSSRSSSSIDDGTASLETSTPPTPAESTTHRLSMEEYYTRQTTSLPLRPVHSPRPYDTASIASTATATTTTTTNPHPSRDEPTQCRPRSPSPPPYASILSARHTLPVLPREEEGHEPLPPYTCSLSLSAVFLKKHELESAVHRATARKWSRILLTLHGTSLTVHACARPFYMPIPTLPDLASSVKQGPLLRTYSLQHAEAGVAADYLKRRYVIRLRVEADQLLLACTDIATHVAWLEALTAAIDVAPPLDDRLLPEENTLPRNMRRRRRRPPGAAPVAATANSAAPAAAARDDAPDTPPLGLTHHHSYSSSLATVTSPPSISSASTATSTSASTSTPAPASTSALTATSPATGPSATPRTDPYGIYPTALIRHPPTTRASRTSRSSRQAPPPRNPNIGKDGKWKPVHNWSPLYDLVYAKRCMATLTSASPRRSRFVIMGGERWVVDWGTGGCVRWRGEGEGGGGGGEVGEGERPPRYEEVVGG